MIQKTVRGRVVPIHDTQSNWESITDFIPKIGESVIYDIDDEHNYERIKIGDGVTNINDLPFFEDTIKDKLVIEAFANAKSSGEVMMFKGVDPLTSLDEDNPKHWAGVLGAGYWWISTDGILTNKPRNFGMLVNFKYGNTEIFQFWLSMMYGDVHTRSGNSSGWGTDWKEIGDDSNCLTYRGKDPITSIELDTPATWNGLGYGMWEITPAGSANIVDGGTCYIGHLINLPGTSIINQLWITPIDQNIYTRSASNTTGTTWANTWKPLRTVESKEAIVEAVLDALPTWEGGSY